MFLRHLPHDLGYAFRKLKRAPGFAATAVLTLALGIGANASVFSMIDRVTIRTPSGIDDAANVRRLEQRFTVAQTRETRQRDVFSWKFKRFRDLLGPELRPWRSSALLFTGLGILALVIAGIGVYGTVAYATTQRTREIGVRLALGANRRDIVGLVVSQALFPVIGGGILGLGLATAVGHFAKAVLYEVAPADITSLAAAATLLSATALLACVVPASQAVRVDPVIALGSE